MKLTTKQRSTVRSPRATVHVPLPPPRAKMHKCARRFRLRSPPLECCSEISRLLLNFALMFTWQPRAPALKFARLIAPTARCERPALSQFSKVEKLSICGMNTAGLGVRIILQTAVQSHETTRLSSHDLDQIAFTLSKV